MPITINGSGTITGLSAGGLPDGTVQPADLSTGAPYWDTSGNVGIGTSSPAVKVNAVGSIAASDSTTPAKRLQLDMGASSGTINCANYGTGMLDLNVQGQTVIFNTGLIGVAERARIDSSGNLLVGGATNSPAARILGQVANGGNCLAITNTSGTAQYNAAAFYNNGTTFTNTGAISVSGTTTAYNTSSDYRLKENVQPMTGALAKVAALKPCTYTWKADGSSGEGFIAHELQSVVPQAVTGDKDAVNEDGSIKPQGIDTSFLVATLTAAIQELNAKVDAQAAEIAALKGAA